MEPAQSDAQVACRFGALLNARCKALEVRMRAAPSASDLSGSMADSATLVRPPCASNPSIAAGLSAHVVVMPLTQEPTATINPRPMMASRA